MRSRLEPLGIELIGLSDLKAEGKAVPEVLENGNTPLENARLKAITYHEAFGIPVFSCDSGLYLWRQDTGEKLPDQYQPGIHVRERDGWRMTDEEMLDYYIGLVKKFGPLIARYQNAICLVEDGAHIDKSMDESLWGQSFLLTDVPHERKVPGFPLDGISLDITTGKYFYDMPDHERDALASNAGIRQFFTKYLEKKNLRDD
jgi:8-oxo-dGTP diphosphatase